MAKTAYNAKFTEIENNLIMCGVPKPQAEKAADVMVTADIYGVTTHGTATANAHIDRAVRGGYNLSPSIKVLRETAAFALVDGDNAMGFVSADYCMDLAATRAKQSGVYTVFCKGGNTFGPAFYYPLKVAKQGVIGIISSNSPAQMAPTGGRERLLGTNPFAAVIPVKGKDPIIIDMASSIVAKSKFKEYKQQGKPLPNGWALDINGNPTNDPDEGIKGFVEPMAGYKGYGIALLIDVLSGVLSGSSYLNNVGRFYTEEKGGMNVGFFCTAIDPYTVIGEDFDSRINDFVNTIRNSKAREDMIISLPGDRKHKAAKENNG